eukprot:CAMPEP_0196780156 /NCGR_PEP_ID=MMETSP1104-20130614/7243_1 /TAXON_ID=33652 /ORGANISM="Cafeteria sp., Strain Caron Lab Isolate" /LENGTH=179 /DNA_ID=CAMNT_0042150347 /DNA_START=9 /DNA_END=548 /DNA_ORIENTATION=+
MRAALLLVIALGVFASSSAIVIIDEPNAPRLGSISSCTKQGSHASDVTVSLDPTNPQAGQNYTLTSSYTLDETVTGGKSSYVGTLNGIPVVSTTTDLCKSLAGSPTPCPLQKGPIKSTTSNTMPSDLPAGTFKGTINWTDQNGEPILCIEVDVVLSGAESEGVASAQTVSTVATGVALA